jgi:multiple sugar transport system permease protein
MLVCLAGLQSIPQSCLDAARVDGASAWQSFRRVTLPMLRSVTWLVSLTGVLGALQMFTLVAVLTQGGPFPLHATDVAVHRIYRTAIGAQAWGMTSALAVIFALVLLVFRWPQLQVVRRTVPRA